MLQVPLILFACLRPDCWTMYFKTDDGMCPGCGSVGHVVRWSALRPDPPGGNRD